MGTPTWRTWTEHASTQKVYVDSSVVGPGSGTISDPYKTLASGYAALRNGFPDWLLLKCGETWEGEYWVGTNASWQKGGLDADNPMVVTSYGTGARPLIKSNLDSGMDISSTSYLIIDDIEFKDAGRDVAEGVFVDWPTAAAVSDFGIVVRSDCSYVTIQSCKISYYDTNIAVLKNQATNLDGPAGIYILGNVCHNAWADVTIGEHAQGIYSENLTGATITHNFCDHNGWNVDQAGAGQVGAAGGKSHGMYHIDSHDTLMEANLSCRNAFLGLKLSSNWGRAGQPADRRVERLIVRNHLTFDQPAAGPSGGGHGGTVPPSDGYAFLDCTFSHNVAIHWGGKGGSTQWTTPGYHETGRPWQRQFLDVMGADGVTFDRNLCCHWNTDSDDGFWDTRGLIEKAVDDDLPVVFKDVTVTNNIGYDVLAGTNHGIQNPAPSVWGFGTLEPSSPGVFTIVEPITVSGNEYAQPAGSYPDPSRNLLSYMTSIGQTGVDDAATKALLYTLIRAQRRTAWNADITADAINSYLRAGFGIPNPGVGSKRSVMLKTANFLIAAVSVEV